MRLSGYGKRWRLCTALTLHSLRCISVSSDNHRILKNAGKEKASRDWVKITSSTETRNPPVHPTSSLDPYFLGCTFLSLGRNGHTQRLLVLVIQREIIKIVVKCDSVHLPCEALVCVFQTAVIIFDLSTFWDTKDAGCLSRLGHAWLHFKHVALLPCF